MKINYKSSLGNIIFGIIAFLSMGGSVFAGSLSFDPTTKSVAAGATFAALIFVDGGADKILGADIVVKYDTNLFEVVSIEPQSKENFLTFARERHSTLGQFYIAAIVTDPAQEITGRGQVAKVTMRAKAGISGTSSLVFECQPGQTALDSNISQNSIDVKDIIVCGENVPLSVTISGTSGTTPGVSTPTPIGSSGISTPTRVPTKAPVVVNPPTQLPKTGVFEDLLKVGIPGIFLVLLGMTIRRYLTIS